MFHRIVAGEDVEPIDPCEECLKRLREMDAPPDDGFCVLSATGNMSACWQLAQKPYELAAVLDTEIPF